MTQVPEFSQFQMYSIEEQVNCCAWAITFENLAESQRRFTEKYNRAAPSRSQINFWKLKLIETGSLVKNRPRSGRPLTATGEENKQIIQEQLNENPHTSIRRLSNENDIPSTSVFRCVKKLGMKPYKPSCCQILSDGDNDRRLQFSEIMIHRFQADPAWLRKLVFSDECNFYLNGTINKHNIHFWATENPHWRLECKTHNTRYLTVWAAIGWNGLIGLDISDKTMTGDRYCEVLNEYVVPYFRRNPSMHYQQDGASPHHSRAARQILDDKLNGRWIGRRGPIEWPARSPDLTPCDYWCWPYLKSLVFENNHRFASLNDLRQAIEENFHAIPLKQYRDSMRNFQQRIHLCHDAEGEVFE